MHPGLELSASFNKQAEFLPTSISEISQQHRIFHRPELLPPTDVEYYLPRVLGIDLLSGAAKSARPLGTATTYRNDSNGGAWPYGPILACLLTSKTSGVRQKLVIWHPPSWKGQLEGQHSSPTNSVAIQDCCCGNGRGSAHDNTCEGTRKERSVAKHTIRNNPLPPPFRHEVVYSRKQQQRIQEQ